MSIAPGLRTPAPTRSSNTGPLDQSANPRTSERAYQRAYDGGAFPRPAGPAVPMPGPRRVQVVLTGAIVAVPLLGLAAAVWMAWGRAITWTDIALTLALYLVTAFGVTVGFHRLITHRSFTAHRWLRIALAVLGSMSFQGNVIDWVAIHRRHHAFTDRPGDPHSPYRYGTHLRGQLRGLAHAHLGWLFGHDPTPATRYAPDLLADPAMVRIARAFPALCAVSLALPFALGWAITGTWTVALTAFLWAGLVRVALLQHVTWSVNSLCHVLGHRPHRTHRHDRSTDLWPLALPSLGESWHNGHHADPSCARHGRNPGQLDLSADLIRLFERLGWATGVHWPNTPRRQGKRPPTRRDGNRSTDRDDHRTGPRPPATVRTSR